jgi:long-subunit acyl-CoA synthetase (AMP-forming)
MLLPSPRNSFEGQLNLFKLTDCKALFTTKDYNLPSELKDCGVPVIYAPSFRAMLVGDEPRKYPFDKPWEEAMSDPFVVLHTSGSTGLPKPIIVRHAWPAVVDRWSTMPHFDGCTPVFLAWSKKRVLNTLPPFHVGARTLVRRFKLLTSLPGSRIWLQFMCFSFARLHVCLGSG